MISIEETYDVEPTQEHYDDVVNKIPLHKYKCSCGCKGKMVIHGYYTRQINKDSHKTPFKICRLRCKKCKRTHAILLSSMVPYSQVTLKDHLSIILSYEKFQSTTETINNSPLLDEGTINYIIYKYKTFWKPFMINLPIKIKLTLDTIAYIVRWSFKHFKRQFLQTKSTINILF